MISARAIAVLEEIALDPDHGAAKGISSKVGEGREAVQSAISELRAEGLIKTATAKHHNGNVISTIRITDAGHRLLETRIHRLLYVLNKQNTLLVPKAYSAYSSIKIVMGAAHGEAKAMDEEWYSLGQMDTDHEEIARLKREDKKQRQEQYREMKNSQAKAKINNLANLQPADWTVDNAVYEFARRMVRWDIPPWEGSRRRFAGAYSQAQKVYQTNGEIEAKMMDLFFARIDHEGGLKDPDMIWKMFIKSFGNLYHEVTLSMVSQDTIAADKAKAAKELEKF